MLQRISQSIIDGYLGKCQMGIFVMKAGYIMFFDAFSETLGIKLISQTL